MPEGRGPGERPPDLATALFSLSAPQSDADVMLGDLEEGFHARAERSLARARFWYWQQVVRSLPSNLKRRFRESAAQGRTSPSKRKGDGPMTSLGYDLRFAWRSLLRNKRLTATIVITLALGIGATTVIFSVIDGVILNPFPFPESSRLVGVGSEFPKTRGELSFFENLSPAEYLDIRDGSPSLTKVVAWDMGNRQVTEGGATNNVFSAFWWGDALPTLGVPAAIGRGFTDDEIQTRAKVALVSHRFWTTHMGADPARVGGSILVNGEPYTLIGVLPRRTLIYGTDLWIPMAIGPESYPRGRRQFQLLGRIAEGRSLEDVNAELKVVAARTDASHRSSQPEYEGFRLEAQSFVEVNTGFMRPAAIILFFAAFFVLAIACVNVASLLLARAVARSREMAMRVTLGARRGQIVRQLVCESLLHALLGAAFGAFVASRGLAALQLALASVALPIPGEIALSGRILLATLATSLAAGLLFGLAPALYALRHNPQSALRAEGGSIVLGTGRLRTQRVFVGFQMAFAALLIASSGLLIRSLMRLDGVDPGIAANEILGFRTTLATQRYGNNGSRFRQFFEGIESELRALPGVKNAALASQTPPFYFSTASFVIEGQEVAAEGALKSAFMTSVSPSYFQTMGIALRSGRLLEDSDREGASPAIVLNEAAAARLFPGGSPLGRKLRFGRAGDGIVAEIVGVVASVKNRGLDRSETPEVFLTLAQGGYPNQLMTVVRAVGDPVALIPAVRGLVKKADSEQPIYQVQTAAQAYASQGVQRRVATVALLIFATFALVLAGAGVYSVASYAAAARTREIGVRMALGATAPQVRRLVAKQALVPVAIGGALGLLAAVAAGQGMASLLFQVTGYDPLALAGSLAVLSLVALSAADGPARRASRTDVVAALGGD